MNDEVMKAHAAVQHMVKQGGTPGGVLLYHDVVADDRFDQSGFRGAGSDIYKLQVEQFDAHLQALHAAFPRGPAVLHADSGFLRHTPFMLTFDDGGESCIQQIAPRLERLGWRAHFFITTNRIGKRGFLSAAQIVALHRQGHIIGSHSASHPRRMSALDRDELLGEWRQSLKVLSELVGAPVRSASIPGGYSSHWVLETAAASDIRFLFSSEPTRRLRRFGQMQIIGRYSAKTATSAALAVSLAARFSGAQLKQWLYWNVLKVAKKSLGPRYPLLREQILSLHRRRAP